MKGSETVTVAGREVAVSNPGKVLFPEAGHTKLDLVRYYLAVAEGALQGAGGRPNVLVRHPNGVGADFFDAVEAEADALGERMRAFCRAMPQPGPERMFSQVYAEASPTVERQREEFLAYHASFADEEG